MCGCNKKTSNRSRPANTTYVPLPSIPVPQIRTLEVAAEKVGEVAMFTSHLLPGDYDYGRVQEALRLLARRLADALP